MAENIFPFLPNLQEQIDNINTNSTTNGIVKLGKVFKFDYNTKSFVIEDGRLVELSEVEAVEQWIEIVLKTYKDKYNVYKDTDFYCNVEDIISQKYISPVFQSELKSEIIAALMKHRYITNVDNFIFTKNGRKLNTTFTVTLLNGTLINKEEVF